MPGYHTRPEAYMGFLIGSRHSHLDCAGYSVDQDTAAAGKELSAKEIVDLLIGGRSLAAASLEFGHVLLSKENLQA
jgi:hypothetical protein